MRKLPNCPIKKKKSQIDHSLGNPHHIKKYGFGLLIDVHPYFTISPVQTDTYH